MLATALSAQQPRYIAVSNEGSRVIRLIDARTHASADGSRLYVAPSDDHPNREPGRDAFAVLDVARAWWSRDAPPAPIRNSSE